MGGLDAVERRKRAAEHVVDAAILMRAFDRQKVGRLLDHADDRPVAPRVGADLTELLLGQVPALAAKADALLHLADRICKGERLLRWDAEDVEGEPLRRPRSHPREAGELRDQVVDEGRKHRPIVPRVPAGPVP